MPDPFESPIHEDGDPIDEPVAEALPGRPAGTTRPPEVWGPGLTLVLGALIAGIYLTVSSVCGIVFLVFQGAMNPETEIDLLTKDLESHGGLLATATVGTAVVVVPLILLLAYLRFGWPVRRYLAFEPVRAKALGAWLLAAVGLLVAADTGNALLGKMVVVEFMRNVFSTAGFPPFLWFALIVAAPLTEELFFRGFLFAGLRRTRLREWGAIALTSLAWASLHVQYGLYEVLTIAVLGVLLGLARWKTESIYPPLVIHSIWNGIAAVHTTWFLASGAAA